MMPALRKSMPFAAALSLLFAGVAAAQAPATQSKVVFPADARIAFVNLEHVFATSREGKAAATELQALENTKKAEITAKTKEAQALEQKLTQGATLLNDEARGRLEREVARVKVDFERLVQDSQAEMQERQQQLQRAFSRRLFPAIGDVAKERNLWAVFRLDQENLLWHNAVMDISDEVVTRLDAAR
jgi:Skp family chaperone for outer membrane proteins